MPVYKPKRPVPFTSVEKVDAELDRLPQLGIITPVDFSQWAAPIVVVKKPGGKIRICADYSTGLNAALESNNYPLPVPDDIFSKLNGCKYFSIIDLSDAYLQVEVDDDSKNLLTINTHRGLFRFNRLAPGVKSAVKSSPLFFNDCKSMASSSVKKSATCYSFKSSILHTSLTNLDYDRILPKSKPLSRCLLPAIFPVYDRSSVR